MRKITLRLCAIIIAMSIAAMLLVGLTACGGGKPEGANASLGNGNPEDIDISAGKTVITIATTATYQQYEKNDIIAQFNNSSDEYYVQVIDYNEFNVGNDPWAGDLRLKTEMLSGNMPDILDLTGMWHSQLVAKGFLEDLYPYIDADPDYSRSDFFEGALSAAEIDGGLYQLFPCFYIRTIVGHPAVLGAEPGWNMKEFMAVIDAHPEADLPLGPLFDKWSFLIMTIGFDIDSYIDLDAGTVNFDTPDFIQLLEFANTFPDELTNADYSNQDNWEGALIPAGRQIMIAGTISSIFAIQDYESLFGGDIVIKGYPSERKIGHSLDITTGYAITTGSENKEGAWQFLRMLLDAEYQATLPFIKTNKRAFDIATDRWLNSAEDINFVASFGYEDEAERMRQENEDILKGADQLREVIETVSGSVGWIGDKDLQNIVRDTSAEYFRGEITAQEAASVIQNRASILMSERN